jgi:hypothetical protein
MGLQQVTSASTSGTALNRILCVGFVALKIQVSVPLSQLQLFPSRNHLPSPPSLRTMLVMALLECRERMRARLVKSHSRTLHREGRMRDKQSKKEKHH